ncbi:MAG: toll/interleukin-1 receptor domain-containing protein [Pyrinomonadaceae bacterium]
MANIKHLELLKQGIEVWNKWISENHGVSPDFSEADLRDLSLGAVSKNGVMHGATFKDANFNKALLSGVTLDGANLVGANFSEANLSGVTLTHTLMFNTNFSFADLSHADFTASVWMRVILGDTDLRGAKGLEETDHFAPSVIDHQTFIRSGKLPTSFLRKCGLPDNLIEYFPSLLLSEPIQFNSCFISYSHKDEDFVRRLYSRMREAELRVWFAPEDIQGGQKIHEQIYQAIQIHDRLLIVLSENSLKSEWVMTEIRKARKVELKENRRKLFPIRLVSFEIIQDWECFDADTGKDLAVEIREYFIPDFSNWKDHDAFEAAFKRLLNDLSVREI